MNSCDLDQIFSFINKCKYEESKKEETKNKLNELIGDYKTNRTQFKGLSTFKQYKIIKYLNQYAGKYYDNDYNYNHYKKLLKLIIRLYNSKINAIISKYLLIQNNLLPITIVSNTDITFDFLRWLVEDYKRISYKYILNILENDKKLKQEFEELYMFLNI